MKIYDTNGNELTERPDYTLGRLVQDPTDSEKYIYTTWDEVPAGEGYGESGKKSKEEQLAALDAEYRQEKANLCEAYTTVSMQGDTETAQSVAQDMADLDAWYDEEYANIPEDESEVEDNGEA